MAASGTIASDGVYDVRAMLAEFRTGPESDACVLRQAALLALGRRATAHPPLSVLMQDAAALLADVLRADLGGVGVLADADRSLMVRYAATDHHGKPVNPVTHTCSSDPSISLAGFALSTASPLLAPTRAQSTLTMPSARG